MHTVNIRWEETGRFCGAREPGPAEGKCMLCGGGQNEQLTLRVTGVTLVTLLMRDRRNWSSGSLEGNLPTPSTPTQATSTYFSGRPSAGSGPAAQAPFRTRNVKPGTANRYAASSLIPTKAGAASAGGLPSAAKPPLAPTSPNVRTPHLQAPRPPSVPAFMCWILHLVPPGVCPLFLAAVLPPPL